MEAVTAVGMPHRPNLHWASADSDGKSVQWPLMVPRRAKRYRATAEFPGCGAATSCARRHRYSASIELAIGARGYDAQASAAAAAAAAPGHLTSRRRSRP